MTENQLGLRFFWVLMAAVIVGILVVVVRRPKAVFRPFETIILAMAAAAMTLSVLTMVAVRCGAFSP